MIYYIWGFLLALSGYVVLLSFRISDLKELEADMFRIKFSMDEIKAEYKCHQDALIRELEEEKLRNERLMYYIKSMGKKSKKKDKSSLSECKCEKR